MRTRVSKWGCGLAQPLWHYFGRGWLKTRLCSEGAARLAIIIERSYVRSTAPPSQSKQRARSAGPGGGTKGGTKGGDSLDVVVQCLDQPVGGTTVARPAVVSEARATMPAQLAAKGRAGAGRVPRARHSAMPSAPPCLGAAARFGAACFGTHRMLTSDISKARVISFSICLSTSCNTLNANVARRRARGRNVAKGGGVTGRAGARASWQRAPRLFDRQGCGHTPRGAARRTGWVAASQRLRLPGWATHLVNDGRVGHLLDGRIDAAAKVGEHHGGGGFPGHWVCGGARCRKARLFWHRARWVHEHTAIEAGKGMTPP